VINQPRAIQDLHTTFTIPQGKIPQTWGWSTASWMSFLTFLIAWTVTFSLSCIQKKPHSEQVTAGLLLQQEPCHFESVAITRNQTVCQTYSQWGLLHLCAFSWFQKDDQ
jgi:hypothetical protein